MHKLISVQQLAMPKRPESLLRRYDVWEPNTDKFEFQWQSRLLQSIWREKRGLVAGNYRGRVRGAGLKMPEAKTTLANYLNESIRSVVRSKVDDPVKAKGKLFGKPRIYNNLLSSQPLCFNLFAELSLDLKLATVFFRK